MHDSQLAELGGCFLEQIESNGSFGKLISRHPCEVPIIDGVYADEYSRDPVACFDGRAEESLYEAADPDLYSLYQEMREEQQMRREQEERENEAYLFDEEMLEDRETGAEICEDDELAASYFKKTARGSVTVVDLTTWDLRIISDLHWPEDSWYLEELQGKDPEETFPQPIKPMQQYGTRAEERRRAKRNGGRKPVGRKNCRVAIRQAAKDKQKVRCQLEAESSGNDLLDEILEDSL